MTNLHLDERRLLDVWSEVSVLSRPGKEVALIAAVTEQHTEQCARLPIGERDRRVILLHERTFGGRYDCETRCIACGMHLAFAFTASDLGLTPAVIDADSLTLTEGRIVVKLRLPTSADVTIALTTPNPAAALFARCVRIQSSPSHKLGEMRASDLPASLRRSAIERLAALDPNADLMFELECPSCEHDNRVMFDPVVALFTRAHQFLPASPNRPLLNPEAIASAPPVVPEFAPADFLERLVRRHTVYAIVHQVTGTA